MNYTNPLLDYIDKVKRMNELVILDVKWYDDEHKGFMEVSVDDCVRKCTLTQMKKSLTLQQGATGALTLTICIKYTVRVRSMKTN